MYREPTSKDESVVRSNLSPDASNPVGHEIMKTRARKSNRGKVEIMGDILNLSTEGIRKTHLMFMANLSYEQVAGYLKELQERGFIEQTRKEGNIIYKTTDNGRQFLESYRNLVQILDGTPPKPVHELYHQG